jgi:hypothetical protein
MPAQRRAHVAEREVCGSTQIIVLADRILLHKDADCCSESTPNQPEVA